MKTMNLTIKNKQGLHVRPSTKFVEIAENFPGTITVKTDTKEVNGKNIMELIFLALDFGDTFTVIANSDEESSENAILNELKQLVEVQKFYET
ncbi:HPr family phosphocarrier protein [Caviibacter abscessus]|uniref:HPr family phosphocarrier protein n=1 Tax=Caviibacter abscessus TaxID=1766719 RepID=UPI00082AB9EC|nr:HPr family phosphocarrier protein [Caviibacter abscessus]